jgi:hypothetical protein
MTPVRYAVAVMPGPRVIVPDAAPSLEPEDDLGIHRSNQAIAWRSRTDCRVKPGNDNKESNAGLRLIRLEA